MTTVTLATGQDVDSSSEAWRAECLARARHVEALQHITGPRSRDLRARYLADLAEKEGAEAAARVKAAFLKAWDAKHPKGAA
mgnify:CR=1 FL=1